MTNITVGISIILTCVTNWTTHSFQDRQLGFVATNHVAEITYRGQKHRFQLLSEPSNIAVWRPLEVSDIHFSFDVTNLFYGDDDIIRTITNLNIIAK